tara:strand:+ start:626 stop:1387 length:762 start_codon:yes stop_codon:yes gene_type:complete
MAGIPDIDAHKIYLGPELPKLDMSASTVKPSSKGPAPFDGTLAVTGPTFLGFHAPLAKGVLNVGAPGLGGFVPKVPTRAVDIEGDVDITGKGPIALKVTGFTKTIGAVEINGALQVNGHASWLSSIVATTKLFSVDHPNIDNYKLNHGCLEGPEHAIYVRGRVSVDGIIELPDYWQNFVDKESITVTLTPIGAFQELFVDRIEYGKRVYIRNQAGGKIDAYYQVHAERIDVDKLEVETKKEEEVDAQYRTTDI